ncbi:conserved hypothetical protein [Talaromyces stipitatus ATCC 10500]|uniref:Zn(2)-C6 fungal-type domain-containing protein n=1 Tax=Talaromyces stipitatus (strain ATCC 10500 / CBS 375.48 / QM 6759 / NRRL 1006) TaxID=441959 RepID=B8MJM8_TALSN|nr:uncharacterized protein TSTA_051640 [Talaromyces stipitatus ATCC 10500]EED15727.1 conserved hypothetical protein [Talaromyces stipitatus ATCC 10500]
MSLKRHLPRNGQRHRSPLACNTCRERRTKCDGQRPKCSFCMHRSKDCFYEGNPDPPSLSAIELSRIWKQLDHITRLIEPRAYERACLIKEQLQGDLFDDQDPLTGFPIMTIKNQSFLALLKLDQSLPARLEQMERSRQLYHSPPCSVPAVMIDFSQALEFLNAFAEHIHIWYPILDADYMDEFLQAISTPLQPSVDSCLALLVLAIGTLARQESIAHAQKKLPEIIYIQAAEDMLPCLLADSSTRSIQCLLLLSVYYLCHAQPCRAHDLVAIASHKIQDSLINEITVQLNLVDSGIWSMDSVTTVPVSYETWIWHPSLPPVRATGDETESIIHEQALRHHDLSYFMAEIAMRKMLQRCTSSFQRLSQAKFSYAPVIAAELERQLQEWYDLLPDELSLRRDNSVPIPPSGSAQAEFLHTQCYAFKVSIYWPAVYQAMVAGEASDDLLLHCRGFFDSYIEFIASAAVSVSICKPNIWTLYASVFTISMAALTASVAPCLLSAVSSRVLQSLEKAVQLFGSVTEVSPSLAIMGTILKERTFHQASPPS